MKSSGTDEAAQRADAVAVAALKPFAVIDAASRVGTPAVGGGPVFEQAVRNAGVPYVSGSRGPATRSLSTRQYSDCPPPR